MRSLQLRRTGSGVICLENNAATFCAQHQELFLPGGKPNMPTTSISTLDAKEEFTELINRVTHYKERIILTRRGKDIAAIVPLEDLMLIQDSQDKNDLQDAAEALKEARNAGTITLEELKLQIR